jgi:hypothetical protein
MGGKTLVLFVIGYGAANLTNISKLLSNFQVPIFMFLLSQWLLAARQTDTFYVHVNSTYYGILKNLTTSAFLDRLSLLQAPLICTWVSLYMLISISLKSF